MARRRRLRKPTHCLMSYRVEVKRSCRPPVACCVSVRGVLRVRRRTRSGWPVDEFPTLSTVVDHALIYAGPASALALGYILRVMAGSVLAAAGGALSAESFPISVRTSVAG
jgi:hypothetical protein